MEEQDFRTVFSLLDLTKRGAVSCEQARQALASIMGPGASFQAVGVELPPYITEDVFVAAMKQAVQTHVPYNFQCKGLLPRPGTQQKVPEQQTSIQTTCTGC